MPDPNPSDHERKRKAFIQSAIWVSNNLLEQCQTEHKHEQGVTSDKFGVTVRACPQSQGVAAIRGLIKIIEGKDPL